ncbi:MAG TPA: tetraacyldisaccharide 4'-kinase [Gammaproteobacteria bacterium]|nr:tetraacyldisaccharide 4'-kinase [Gammaproteobacteria bacterium]
MTKKLRECVAKDLQARWYRSRAPWFLLPPAGLFGAAAALRRTLYAHGMLKSVRVSARVVVVGNIAVGGSGKTPLVAWLAQRLAADGLRVGIVTRGYGGYDRGPRQMTADTSVEAAGDEALWLARTSGVPVVAGRDRVAAARLLVETAHPEIILSDDGLQHYRLARDAEVVAVDARRGYGNGALLPAGPLREPLRRIASAQAVVLKGEGNATLPAEVRAFRMHHALGEALPLAGGEPRPLSAFAGTPVRALAAIADPEGFFRDLEGAGLEVERHALPDHAPVADAVARLPADRPLLMTDKDAVKLAAPPAHAWRVPLVPRFEESDANALLAIVRGTISRPEEFSVHSTPTHPGD